MMTLRHEGGAEFLDLGTSNILGQILLCHGGCPVRCKMFSSIPCLYPLDSSNNNQKCLQTLPIVPWGWEKGADLPLDENC